MNSHRGSRALLTAAAVVLFSTGAGACAGTVHPRAGVVYVASAPPRAIREVRPAPLGRVDVWIPGFYRYEGRSYVWVPGRYARPASANVRRWDPGEWRHNRNGWFWVEGRWR